MPSGGHRVIAAAARSSGASSAGADAEQQLTSAFGDLLAHGQFCNSERMVSYDSQLR
jgi:hypothetical protein